MNIPEPAGEVATEAELDLLELARERQLLLLGMLERAMVSVAALALDGPAEAADMGIRAAAWAVMASEDREESCGSRSLRPRWSRRRWDSR